MATAKRITSKEARSGDGKRQAEDLSQAWRKHATETEEDYMEASADLIAECGEACVVDSAKRLGVTHLTMNRTIARFQKSSYITSQAYRANFLMDLGCGLAVSCKGRHETVAAFLGSIGAQDRIAEMDAECIEHYFSPETLAAFERLLEKA